MATSMLKESTSSQKMATSMLKVASDIYKMPLYRNAHSPENSSEEWAFFFPCIKFTFVVTQIATKSWIKIIIFHLSQSKCTVSALFLHGFKGCNGHSDLQNTAKGAEITRQKITMLCAKIT
jgi:type IV secretory pathway VirB6-like protein